MSGSHRGNEKLLLKRLHRVGKGDGSSPHLPGAAPQETRCFAQEGKYQIVDI